MLKTSANPKAAKKKKKAAEKAEVKAEAIPISLGVKPQDLGLDEDVSINPF